jgi:integrase
MAELDPLKITLDEAAKLYTKEIGTTTISAFGEKGKFKKYGKMPLVKIFEGNVGSRVLDEMLATADTAGKFNSLIDNLRLATKPVRRLITQSDSTNPILGKLPEADAGSELTKTIFGERKVAEEGAKVAILTNNKAGWKEFFDQIDAIADDPKHPKQALANALRISYYSGPRPGLIAGLQGSEYLVDQGAIYVQPQTKQVGAGDNQETRKGASKGTTSFKKKAVPYTVPLGENAHAYLQQQLKINANDPDIVKYLAEQKKLGKSPIFVQKTIGKDGKVKVSPIETPAMTAMLSDIKTSTPIIVDNISGDTYNSLNPKEIKNKQVGKWGSALTRNIHGTIAKRQLNIDKDLIDFLHGRSETSGTEGRGQTEKLGYALRPRGEFSQGERDGQQLIGNWINGVQEKSAVEIPDVQNKVSKTNYAIEGFFDPIEKTVETTTATNDKSNIIQKLLNGEVNISDQMKAWREKKRANKTGGGGKLSAGIIGAASAISGLMSGDAEAAADTGAGMVAEEILEKGTIETLKKAGLASRNATPLGLGLTIAASSVSTIGEQGFEKENRLAQQLGVTRNDILKLSSDEKEKLFKLFEDNKRNQLVKEQEEISLGEQMRNLSTPPTVSNMRMLDNGNTSTDRTGQI